MCVYLCQGNNYSYSYNIEQVNGVNLLHIPARDAYAYGLQLMDALFTKQELAGSLIFKSKKSEKQGLDQDRV